MQELRETSTGFVSSKIIEDMNNKLRARGKQHKANFLGRLGRWHACAVSDLLRDSDRQEISITAAAKSVSVGDVPRQVFDHNGEEASIDYETVTSLGGANPSWPNISPETWRRSSLNWAAACAMKSWAKLQTSWVSMLASPGWCLVDRRVGMGSVALVTKVTKYGALVWRMTWKRLPGNDEYLYASFQAPGDSEPWEVMAITAEDYANFWALRVDLLPPQDMKDLSRGQWVGTCGMCAKKGSGMSLLKQAASVGFPQLLVTQLRGLLNLLPIDKAKWAEARAEIPILELLLGHILPSLPPEEVKRIISQRGNLIADDGNEGACCIFEGAKPASARAQTCMMKPLLPRRLWPQRKAALPLPPLRSRSYPRPSPRKRAAAMVRGARTTIRKRSQSCSSHVQGGGPARAPEPSNREPKAAPSPKI